MKHRLLHGRAIAFRGWRLSASSYAESPQGVGYGPSLRGDERRLDDQHRPFMPEWRLRAIAAATRSTCFNAGIRPAADMPGNAIPRGSGISTETSPRALLL
jgi:hypothetical protein